MPRGSALSEAVAGHCHTRLPANRASSSACTKTSSVNSLVFQHVRNPGRRLDRSPGTITHAPQIHGPLQVSPHKNYHFSSSLPRVQHRVKDSPPTGFTSQSNRRINSPEKLPTHLPDSCSPEFLRYLEHAQHFRFRPRILEPLLATLDHVLRPDRSLAFLWCESCPFVPRRCTTWYGGTPLTPVAPL